MIAAATLVTAAGSASAQTTLKAEIPFTFRAGTSMLAAGSYNVVMYHSSGAGYFVLRNRDNQQSVILAHYVAEDAPKAWRASRAPRLGFECAGDRCVLRQAWTGDEEPAYRFRGPKLGDEPTRIAEIRMTLKAD
jgi:hypothetical protein